MLDVLTVGYPSSDLIMRVSRAPSPGETATILDKPTPNEPHPGGCGANIAVGLARLGLKAGVVAAVGNDPASRRYLARLSGEGVDVSGVLVVPEGDMAHCFLFVTPEGDHQTFYYPGVNAGKPPAILDRVTRTPVRWGVVTVAPREHSLKMAQAWNQAGVPILWSLRRDPQAFPPELTCYLADVSRVAVMNDAEAEMVRDVLGLSHIRGLLSYSLEMAAVVITQGAEGCLVLENGGETRIPAVPPRRFVDPTGAGDAFCSGMLWGLVRDFSWTDAAKVGAVVASFVLERLGAQAGLPDASDVRARYLEFFGEELMPV